MQTTMGAMRWLVVAVVVAVGACGSEPLPVAGETTEPGAGGVTGDAIGAVDAGAGGGSDVGADGHQTCAAIAAGDSITDESGATIVNARCDRQCSPSTCLRSTGDSVYCSFCAKPVPPPCAQPIVNIDSCQDRSSVPGPLCCYSCYVDDFHTQVRGCTGVTGTGTPVVCATSIDDCK